MAARVAFGSVIAVNPAFRWIHAPGGACRADSPIAACQNILHFPVRVLVIQPRAGLWWPDDNSRGDVRNVLVHSTRSSASILLSVSLGFAINALR